MPRSRIFETTTTIYEGLEGHQEEVGVVRYAVDLENVAAIRERHDDPNQTMIWDVTGFLTVNTPYADVLRAWHGYMESSDSLIHLN